MLGEQTKEKRKKVKGILRAFLAQSVERAAFNRKVVGSRPTGGVFLQRGKQGNRITGCIAQW